MRQAFLAVFLAALPAAAAQSAAPLPPKANAAAWHLILGNAQNNSVTLICSVARNPPFPGEYPKDVKDLVAAVDAAERQRALATQALSALTPGEAALIGGYVARWMKSAKDAVACLHSIQKEGMRPAPPDQLDPRFDGAQKSLTDGTFQTLRVAGGLYGQAAVEPTEQDLLKALHN